MSNNLPFTLTESAKLKGAITRLFTSAAKVETAVQDLTLSAIYHMREHGDSTHVVRLMAGFPKGSRVERWAAWISRNFPLNVNIKAGKVTRQKFIKLDDGTTRDVCDDDWNWSDAVNTPWHAKVDASNVHVASVKQLLAKIAKYAETASKVVRTDDLTHFAVELAKLKGFDKLCEKYLALEEEHAKAATE